MKQIFSFILLVACLSVGDAYALPITPITVDANITDNTYMAAQSSLIGKFDIKLSPDAPYNLPYDIVSAVATFDFIDDNNDLTVQNTVIGSYEKWYKVNNDQSWLRYEQEWSLNENEQVELNITGKISDIRTKWYEIPPENWVLWLTKK